MRKFKKSKNCSKPQLLATLGTSESLSRQNTIDSQVLNEQSNNLNLAQCKQTSFDKKDLSANLQKAPGSTLREDFGRYVGFNTKTFKRSGVAGLVLKLFFWENNHCYGIDKD